MNNQVKVSILSIMLGLLFAYLSIIISGYAAAVAVPEFAQSSPIVAISAIDFIAGGIPLAILFIVFALIIRRVNKNNIIFPYIILALPFFVLHLLFGAVVPVDFLFLVAILPKFALVAFCVAYFVTKQGSVKA